MKLIEQLVDYLRSRGALAPEQLTRLAGKGFIEPPEADDRATSRDADDDRDWDDFYPEPAPPRPARRGGKRGATPVAQQTTAEELTARLAERFPTWAEGLGALTEVGRRFGADGGWQDAAEVLAKRSSAELSAALTAALRERTITADLLWDALHFEAYREGLDALGGRVANAYRALLAGGDVSEFSKHKWLLKYEGPAAVYRLVRAQKALTRALPAVYREAPELIRRGLRRGEYTRPLALLEAARWAAQEFGRLSGRPLRCFVLRTEDEAWWPAWSLALQIDPAGVAALLARCRVDPFVAVPADFVPGELVRFAPTAEEVGALADADESVRAALESFFSDANRARPGVMRRLLRHPIPFIRETAVCKEWDVDAAEFEPLLQDPDARVRAFACRTLIVARNLEWKGSARAGELVAEGLRGGEAGVRKDALTFLLRILGGCPLPSQWEASRPALTASLIDLIAGPDDAAAADAAGALWPVIGPDAIPVLEAQLAHPAPARRFAAAMALWRAGSRSAACVRVLMEAAETAATVYDQRDALAALGDFGEAAGPALPVLVRALGSDGRCVGAAKALEKLGPHAVAVVPDLVRAFTSDGVIYGRENLAKVLQAAPPAAVWPFLVQLILFEAKQSASYFGPMAREVLRPFVERGGEVVGDAVRALAAPDTAAAALDRLRSDGRGFSDGLARLASLALGDAASPAGRKALEVCTAVGANACPAVVALIHRTQAADPGVRAGAGAVLAELARLAASLTPQILKALRDVREEVRAAATALLQWVGPIAVAAAPHDPNLTGDAK